MALRHDFLQLIRDGELVEAGVPNRVFEQIDANIRYLAGVLDAAAVGSTVFARSVPVEADAQVGMAVYFDDAEAKFKRGLAAARTDPSTGVLAAAPSADIWGVVHAKASATVADLLLFGYAELDISTAAGGEPVAGTYHLSSQVPGGLTTGKPPVCVPVLRSDGAGNVFVSPTIADFVDRHVHYKFALECAPAGDTSPPEAGRHEIVDADDSLPGWLPADHEAFDGKAPAGAVFGYNLDAHPSLKAAFPPLPLGNAVLVWDKGLSKDVGGTEVPLGSDGLCVIDKYGIWWMSDCEGDVPWPADLDTSSPDSYSDSADSECPRHLQMALTLWFTRVQFATDATAVTSLRTRDDRITIRCYGTEDAAATGDLEIALDFSMAVTEEDALGGQVLKSLEDGNKFKSGWACEGVYAETANVTLTSERQRRKTPGDATTPLVHQGLVGISVSSQASLELPVELVRLDSVNEEYLFDLMYLGFPAGERTSLRGKIRVPADVGISSPQLSLRLRVLGRSAGTLPDLTVTYRRVPANSPATTPLVLPGTGDEETVSIATDVTLTLANQYVEAQGTPFEVAAGDTVFFTVERADDDAYNAEVGILQMTGMLSQGG